MKKTFNELLDAVIQEELQKIPIPEGVSTTEGLEKWDTAQKALYQRLFVPGSPASRHKLSMSEAITTRDFPALLQRTLDFRLTLPVEPAYIGQTLLATTIPVGRIGGQYRIPAFGYLQASEISEGGEYPDQIGEIVQNQASIAIRKFGIKVSVTQEAMEADEMGLWALHVEAARRAMIRLKEEQIFTMFQDIAIPTFDNLYAWGSDFATIYDMTTINSGAPYAAQSKFATTGRDYNGNLNGTVHLYDFIDTMAALVARRYPPTDILINPMAWAVFARNPSLNGFYQMQRGTPEQVAQAPQYSATGPNSIGNVPMPWNVTLNVSPFVTVNTTQAGSPPVPILTNIYIGSRQNGLVILQGQPMSQEAYNDIQKEVYNVRLKEYYGLGIADAGRSWAAIKNVRLDTSWEIAPVRLV